MCIVCDRNRLGPELSLSDPGAVAQLVERRTGSPKVVGSKPISSTLLLPDLRPLGFMLGGFVAGEGSFSVTRKLPALRDGSPRLSFVFSITVAARDEAMLELLRSFLGYGSIASRKVINPKWQPQVVYTVKSLIAHEMATIPFADEFLLPSSKRDQFYKWKESMKAYVDAHPPRRGRSTCKVEGCEKLVRGRGLCRSHYYQATGW